MSKCTRKRLAAQAIEQAMAEHDGLVHAFIRRQGGGDIPYEEAVQAGRIGLWRAIQGYDAKRGTSFSTYAWVAIYRHIHQAVVERVREVGDGPSAVAVSDPAADPETWVEQQAVVEALSDLVARLPKRLRRVIVARYGLWGQRECLLKEIGAELGVCGERVRQLEQDALSWLRHPAHSWRLRQLMDKNTAADYRHALAQNAALRRSRRQKR